MSNYGATSNFGNSGYSGPGGFQNDNSSPLNQAIENTRTLNSIVARLDKNISLLNTSSDSENLRQEIKQLRESSVLLIRDTAALLQRPSSPNEKPLQQKTIQEFTEIVSKCRNVSQASLQKESAFPLRGSQPSFDAQKSRQNNDLRMQQMEAQVPLDLKFEEIQEIEIDNEIIKSRNKDMQKINEQLHLLKDVTIDVAKIVESNDTMLINAEKHTAASSSISKNAVVALEGALKSQKKSRTKVCCAVCVIVIAILVVAFVIVIVGLMN